MKIESFCARQVAVVLRITVDEVRQLVARRRLVGRHFDGGWQISRDELLATCVFAGCSTRWSEVV